jgi:hypothetical protein
MRAKPVRSSRRAVWSFDGKTPLLSRSKAIRHPSNGLEKPPAGVEAFCTARCRGIECRGNVAQCRLTLRRKGPVSGDHMFPMDARPPPGAHRNRDRCVLTRADTRPLAGSGTGLSLTRPAGRDADGGPDRPQLSPSLATNYQGTYRF